MEEKENLAVALREQILRAKECIDRSLILEGNKINGSSKLTKRIRAELKFLNELKEGDIAVKPCHLNSTNLSHLGAVLDVAESIKNEMVIIAVLKPVTWYRHHDSSDQSTIIVDVVTPQSWFKVTARNPMALHKSWQGDGNFGDKSIDEQAKEYMEASEQHKLNYAAPKVIFVFTQGVTEMLAECLSELGVTVKGHVLPNPGSDTLMNPTLALDEELLGGPLKFECKKVNLDVTAMIALVSGLTNGSCHYKFQEQVLTDQAERERSNPLLPHLNKFLEGKQLYSCTLAISSFKTILDTIGGAKEKQRARELLSRITEVSNNPSLRSQNLSSSAKIKPRPKIVFGTGDTLEAVTVSSNGSFVRAAREQGVEFAVFIHEPRALTETKEPFATSVKDET